LGTVGDHTDGFRVLPARPAGRCAFVLHRKRAPGSICRPGSWRVVTGRQVAGGDRGRVELLLDPPVRSKRSALRATPVGVGWITNTLGMTTQAVREDRILNELHATGGDVRRICDLFGLSIAGAARYASVLNHPELDHA